MSDSVRPCPVCGTEMYQPAAPGVWWCEDCEYEYWRERNGWWRCDTSGEPENVKAVADGGSVHYHGPKHVVIEVPPSGREPAKEALNYRVGPAVNWEFFHDWRRQQMLILWGERLSESTLEALSTACHELEREHADIAMYDGAKGADRMESAFLFENRQERYLHTGRDQSGGGA